MKIRNINEKFGDAIEFEGSDLLDCISEMASSIVACGPELSLGQTCNDLCYSLTENVDYEIVID